MQSAWAGLSTNSMASVGSVKPPGSFVHGGTAGFGTGPLGVLKRLPIQKTPAMQRTARILKARGPAQGFVPTSCIRYSFRQEKTLVAAGAPAGRTTVRSVAAISVSRL